MRIPLVPQLSTKEGVTNKNARMTNVLAEKNPTGTVFGAVRPGLLELDQSSGNGRGMVGFNGELLVIYGSSLYLFNATGFVSIGAVEDQMFDFTQSPL